jgi:hypothetical protein
MYLLCANKTSSDDLKVGGRARDAIQCQVNWMIGWGRIRVRLGGNGAEGCESRAENVVIEIPHLFK